MQISGKIIAVLDPKSGVSSGGKEWKRQEFVVETQERYPRKVYFTIFGSEKIDNAPLIMGAIVNVDFDVDAREYNGKWYNDVEAWRVTLLQAPQGQSAAAVQQPAAQGSNFPPQVDTNGAPTAGGSNDDLPF